MLQLGFRQEEPQVGLAPKGGHDVAKLLGARAKLSFLVPRASQFDAHLRFLDGVATDGVPGQLNGVDKQSHAFLAVRAGMQERAQPRLYGKGFRMRLSQCPSSLGERGTQVLFGFRRKACLALQVPH